MKLQASMTLPIVLYLPQVGLLGLLLSVSPVFQSETWVRAATGFRLKTSHPSRSLADVVNTWKPAVENSGNISNIEVPAPPRIPKRATFAVAPTSTTGTDRQPVAGPFRVRVLLVCFTYQMYQTDPNKKSLPGEAGVTYAFYKWLQPTLPEDTQWFVVSNVEFYPFARQATVHDDNTASEAIATGFEFLLDRGSTTRDSRPLRSIIYYTGHGSNKGAWVLPRGQLLPDDLMPTLLRRLPAGAVLTIVSDMCYAALFPKLGVHYIPELETFNTAGWARNNSGMRGHVIHYASSTESQQSTSDKGGLFTRMLTGELSGLAVPGARLKPLFTQLFAKLYREKQTPTITASSEPRDVFGFLGEPFGKASSTS